MQSLRKELVTQQELPSEGSEKTGGGMPETARRHFCCIIFVGSKSLGPAHTQGWGVTQKHGPQEAQIPEATVAMTVSPSTLASCPSFNTQGFVPAWTTPPTAPDHAP